MKKRKIIFILCGTIAIPAVMIGSAIFNQGMGSNVNDEDHSILVSEIVAQPMEMENAEISKLSDEEKAELPLDHRITDDTPSETAFSYQEAYYIFYGKDRNSSRQKLATAKLTVSLEKIKNQDEVTYDEVVCNFELYCEPKVRMENYEVAIQSPGEKRYTFLEESYFTIQNIEKEPPYEMHEIINQFEDLSCLRWRGAALNSQSGSAYKISPEAVIKVNNGKFASAEVSWSLRQLKLKQKSQTFELGETLELEQGFRNHKVFKQ